MRGLAVKYMGCAVMVAAAMLATTVTGQTEPAPPATLTAATLPVTRVTVALNPGLISDAFGQLDSQSGLHFGFSGLGTTGGRRGAIGGGPDRSITFNAKDQPLWTVLRDLYEKAGYEKGTAWTMAIPEESNSWRVYGRMSVDGPFLVMIQSIVHEADYGRIDPDVERYQVNLQVALDPAIQVNDRSLLPRIDKALDENGGVFTLIDPATPAAPNGGTPVPRPGPSRQPLVSPNTPILLRPPTKAGRMLTLEGAYQASMITRSGTVELPVPGSLEKNDGGVQVSYSVAASGADSYAVTVTAARPPGMSEEIWAEMRPRLLGPQVNLLDAAGKTWATIPSFGVRGSAGNGGTARTIVDGQQVQVIVTFTRRVPGAPTGRPAGGRVGVVPAAAGAPGDALLPPAKATINYILEAQKVDIPFRFEKMPLR